MLRFLWPIPLLNFHRLLPTQRQEFLQRHDLIVELHFPLWEGTVALSWIVSTLGQLADFLSDSRNFGPVIVLSVAILVVDLLVLVVFIWEVLRITKYIDSLAIRIDVIQGLVHASHVLNHLCMQVLLAPTGSSDPWTWPTILFLLHRAFNFWCWFHAPFWLPAFVRWRGSGSVTVFLARRIPGTTLWVLLTRTVATAPSGELSKSRVSRY